LHPRQVRVAAALNPNLDEPTVAGFGDEWSRFVPSRVPVDELRNTFAAYFSVFPWDELPARATGFDLGCGSGRWAALVAPRVGELHCVDASAEALAVARRTLRAVPNVHLHERSVDDLPFADGSMDFGYALGVLHHVPDTPRAIASCARKLKRGAPLLLYLYYAFDNRPAWYRWAWRASDAARRVVARLPFGLRAVVADGIAGLVYLPLARLARLLEGSGRDVAVMPLAFYRHRSFYTMRTDARDRFGTRLEQRFTRGEIEAMMRSAGLGDVEFSDAAPFWCVVGRRA
jgi:SAM-dependent methyltransferase